MEGLPKLKLLLHCDVRSRKIDGVRVFDGENLVGAISLEDLKLIYEDRRQEMTPQDVEQKHGTSTT
jgi:hypothetical protein